MAYENAFQISAAGLAVEKLRVDTAAANIAHMHSAAPNAAQLYRPLKVVADQALAFSRQFDGLYRQRGAAAQVVEQDAAPRLAYEPGHPYANDKGFVAYPGVDQTQEMLTLTTALRAYEANVVAMTAAKTMAARALEIGGQQ